VLARVAAAFEAVDADGVAADRFSLQRMPHRGAFVDDPDAGLLECRQPLLGIVARRLDDLDAALEDGLGVAGIVGGRTGGAGGGRLDCPRTVGWSGRGSGGSPWRDSPGCPGSVR